MRSPAVEFRFEQSGLELLLEAEAFAFDVDRDRMMEQAIEDGAGDLRGRRVVSLVSTSEAGKRPSVAVSGRQ